MGRKEERRKECRAVVDVVEINRESSMVALAGAMYAFVDIMLLVMSNPVHPKEKQDRSKSDTPPLCHFWLSRAVSPQREGIPTALSFFHSPSHLHHQPPFQQYHTHQTRHRTRHRRVHIH